MPVKQEMILVHVRKLHLPPSRWTKSQTILAPLKYIDVSRTAHTNLDVKQERRIDDYWNIDGSRDLSDSWTGFHSVYSFRRETSRRIYVVWERLTKRQLSSMSDHLWPELWTKLARNAKLREKQKWAIEKNHSSIMLDNYEEFILLTLRTWSSRKSSKMQGENWKHQWLPPCLPRHARKARMERPVARLMISSLNLRVSWKPVNPQEYVWKNLYQIIMRTKLQVKGTIHCNTTIWYTNFSYASSHEDSCSKRSSG